MEIDEEHLDGDAYRIVLSGRMDIVGVGGIEGRFAEMTASPRTRIIVDMAAVPYMSSIGIRALLINAKALHRRGGRLVILRPHPHVLTVLKTASIDEIIPICDTLDDARAKVAG